ncbi:MAG: FAD-dependent oxidoreductase [Patescibacteria group bacterium]|nr:FAD-dependent oxidoreductase [Patescibacteria group bacterium]
MTNIKKEYPLVIIGTGPAGLTASIYASRYRVDNLIIGQAMGGLVFEAHKICNFPSEKEVTGRELTEKMQDHAQSLGASILIDQVTKIRKEKNGFTISTGLGHDILAKTLLLAIGTKHRKLELPNEDRFLGKGISYCATCDAMFYQDKTVAVIGGSDSAHTASLYLSEIAKHVYQIYRGEKMRGEVAWIQQLLENDKIEVIYNTQVTEVKGKDKLEGIVLDNSHNGQKEISIHGLFIEIGTIPRTDLAKELDLDLDQAGYIKVEGDQRASEKGIWAAGDITTNSNGFRQIVNASSEGAVAAESIFKYLQTLK